MLTLIKKKKYHLCLPGKSSPPHLWRPRPPPPPARLPFHGAPRGNQIPAEAGCPPTGGALTPRSVAEARGRWALKEVSTPGGFPSAQEPDLAI